MNRPKAGRFFCFASPKVAFNAWLLGLLGNPFAPDLVTLVDLVAFKSTMRILLHKTYI
jgi:hypothetical protein